MNARTACIVLVCTVGLVAWSNWAAAQDAVVPAAAGKTGFFASLATFVTKSHAECCQTPIGQMMNSMTMPLSFMTGGLIGQKCAGANPPPGSAGAIQQNQADAKARAAAVRYLATVDCHWYPEAEKQLIASLRADPSECVRWEAAKALQTGCCCSKNTIDALTITVTGSNRDGNPSENSLRVQAEAFIALQLCMQKVDAAAAEQPQPLPPEAGIAQSPTLAPALPEVAPTAQSAEAADTTKAPIQPVAATLPIAESEPSEPLTYEQVVAQRPMSQLLAEARQALESAQSSSVGQVSESVAARPGQRNLYSLWVATAERREITTEPPANEDPHQPANAAAAAVRDTRSTMPASPPGPPQRYGVSKLRR